MRELLIRRLELEPTTNTLDVRCFWKDDSSLWFSDRTQNRTSHQALVNLMDCLILIIMIILIIYSLMSSSVSQTEIKDGRHDRQVHKTHLLHVSRWDMTIFFSKGSFR